MQLVSQELSLELFSVHIIIAILDYKRVRNLLFYRFETVIYCFTGLCMVYVWHTKPKTKDEEKLIGLGQPQIL